MKTKNILTTSLVFTIITFLPSALNFILLPVYTKYLSVVDYGILSLSTSVTSFFLVIGAFRTSTAINSYYYELMNDRTQLNIFYGTVLKFSFLSNLIIGILFLLPVYFLSIEFFKSTFQIGYISMLIGLISSSRSCFLIFHKNDQNLWKYCIQYLAVSAGLIIFQLYALVYLHSNTEGVIMARLLSEVLGLVMILYIERDVLKTSFNRTYARYAFNFSLPLISSAFIGWVYFFGDRYFIALWMDMKTLGIYGFMITISSLISMLTDSITHGIQPFLFRNFLAKDTESEWKINIIYKFYIQAVMIFSSVLLVAGFNIDLIISNKDYLSFTDYFIGGILVFIADAYTKLFSNSILFHKRTKFIMNSTIMSVTLSVILYLILIPPFKIWGAILANFISNTFLFSISYYFSNKHYRLNTSFLNIFLFPGIQIMLMIAYAFVTIHFIQEKYLLSILFLLIQLIAVYSFIRKDIRIIPTL